MDPYQELGVSRSISEADLQKAFRKLAKQYHPDANQNNPKAEDRFKRISAAYDFLNDPIRRKRFDRGEINAEGQELRRASAGPGFSGGAGRSSQGFDGFDFADIFESMNAGGAGSASRRGTAVPKGEDLQFQLEIDWVDSLKDHAKRISLEGEEVLTSISPRAVKQIRY